MSSKPAPKEIETDVFIAGSGPIGCTYARKILDETKDLPTKTKVWMFEIGAQNDPVIGAHHKNSVKYQKDIDAFVHVIQGALQAVSVPPASTYMPTLSTSAATQVPQYHTKEARIVCNRKPEGSVSGQASNSDMPPCSWPQWPVAKPIISSFFNPNQQKELNLPGCRITRTVGGMATHWTCACPRPHDDEIKVGRDILGASVLEDLLGRAEQLLNVTTDQFSGSIRHNLVMSKLKADERFHDRVRPLPLAVKRENQELVTWSGTNTVLGDWSKQENCCSNPECTHENCRFALYTEYKVVKLNRAGKGAPIESALVHNLRTGENFHVKAKAYIIACGAVCTPQILWNSGFGEREGDPDSELPALGRYLTEQSLSFCQIVLNRTHFNELHSLVDIKNYNNRSMMFQDMKKEHFEFQQARLKAHRKQFEEDPIPIPFTDPEPQVNLKYTTDKPWHAQIHRDAFSYGDVGERADPRMVVDLRFFGKQEASPCNRVKFEDKYTDIYGLPQPTFEVHRSQKDVDDDQRMMVEMCEAAQVLGAFMPRSYPQFMEPGLALHITGTTRIGNDVKDSVANKYSEVHGHPNLYVGGNNVIPDSTACNPTLTSVAYALYSAGHIVENLKKHE